MVLPNLQGSSPEGSETPKALTLSELKLRQKDFNKSFLSSKSESTRSTYNRCLNEFGRWIGSQGGSCFLSKESMEDYRDYLEIDKSLSFHTVSTYFTALRQFCKYLYSTGFLSGNPARDVGPSTKSNASFVRGLCDREIKALLSEVSTDSLIGKRDMSIMYCMLYGGLTEVRIERAHVGDLELTLFGLLLHVRRKRNSFSVPLDDPIRGQLLSYLESRGEEHPEAPLFTSHSHRSKGGRLDARSIRRRINNYLESSGVRASGVKARSLTLTALRIWTQRGMSLSEIKERHPVRGLEKKIEMLLKSHRQKQTAYSEDKSISGEGSRL